MNTTLELMQAHRSIRKFEDRPVDEKTLKAIVAAAQCAASSHFVQAYTVIRVKDGAVRKAIARLAGPQVWVERAPLFLMFCADLKRLEQVCAMQGKKPETGWAEQFVTATVDTALLAQNVMLAAESLGLGGVYIGGIRNDPATVCDLLALPEQVYPVFGMCLGWPADQPPVKPRLPVEAVLFDDRYPEAPDRSQLAAYDQAIRHYYLNRDSNLKDETWSGQMARFMGRVFRPHMKDFLQKQGFFLK